MGKLNHTNIVSLHEVVSVDDFYYLVLDFYPGGNLCDMNGNQEGFKLQEEIASLSNSRLRTRCASAEVTSNPFLWISILSNPASVCCPGDLRQAVCVHPGGRHVVSRGVPLCHVSDQRNSSVSDHRGQTLNHQHRLSGRLPFDVEEDCSKHQQLIAMINEGFTDEISAGLGAKVSVEARLLVSRLLTVHPNLRIKVAPILKPFLTSVEGEGCCSLLLGHST